MADNHDTWHWQEPGKAWKGAGLYHITLTVTSRQPLLGELLIPEDDPAKAWVSYSDLAKAVLECVRQVPAHYPMIQVLHYRLMPDHLHMIWYVRQTLPQGIQAAVRGFWQGAKQAARDYYASLARNYFSSSSRAIPSPAPSAPALSVPIFAEMPFIRPMGQYRQLPTTVHYIDMNPQRLATKRLKPGFFCVQDNIEIGGRVYRGVGNAQLLNLTRYTPVHVRRTMLDAAAQGNPKPLSDYMDSCIAAARQGAVLVSPFIHEKEREVLYIALSEGGSVICLADNGFREYYKPSDGLFDAVANEQMLILSPWPYDPHKRGITRAECVAMNQMAEEICLTLFSASPNGIRDNSKKNDTHTPPT